MKFIFNKKFPSFLGKLYNIIRMNNRSPIRRQNQRSREKKYFHHNKNVSLPPVDRNEVPPFMCKVAYCINKESEVKSLSSLNNENSLTLYLWMDSTLNEIMELMRAHLPHLRTKQRFVFFLLGPKPNQNKDNKNKEVK